MAENMNRVVITGNLTRDPEYKEPRDGLQIANLRVAVNEREKKGDGTWGERANYFDVTCFGAQARNVNQYLKKGSALAIDGRLRWRDWEDGEGNKRQAVSIVADNVQFLGEPKGGGNGQAPPQSDVPADTSDFATAAAPADDDIPF